MLSVLTSISLTLLLLGPPASSVPSDEAVYGVRTQSGPVTWQKCSTLTYSIKNAPKRNLDAFYKAIKDIDRETHLNLQSTTGMADITINWVEKSNDTEHVWGSATAEYIVATNKFKSYSVQLRTDIPDRVLYAVVAHELGHAVGLGHVNEPSLMYYQENENLLLSMNAKDKYRFKQVVPSCNPLEKLLY